MLEINLLRSQHYNATLTTFNRVHDDLAIIRVLADDGPVIFEPGQYTVLGLGNWEARIDHSQPESSDGKNQRRLIRRAYSISGRLLDEQGNLERANESPELEFYVALVRRADSHPPALTPRLFLLNEGSRLYMGRRAHGRYTSNGVTPDSNVIFCATGTGEAPHNAMIAELLTRGHQGRIVSVVSVRHRRDLAYLEKHRLLAEAHDNYFYKPITTREPENIDASHVQYQGKRYIQDYFESNELQAEAGFSISPNSTHIYLCGNPAMVGLARPQDTNETESQESTGMLKLLERRGFKLDQSHDPGNIHVEQYW